MDDVQSWWEVPSIAHFCSLFRAAFNLLDFDIEELEEALLTDGTEDTGSSLLQELIVRLLCGCYGRQHGISIFNYQMFLRRLFRTKCREYGRENPFDTDVDFQFLPLRTKVEILQALCDFRLDADDVMDCLKNLESDSLRLQPLGYDRNQSAYWYFYGTRLYREDYPKKKKEPPPPPKRGRKRKKEEDNKDSIAEEEELDLGAGVWQVVCYSEEDWSKLALRTKDAPCKQERTLHHVLVEDFLPEIPRLFEEKRNLQRKRLMEMAPRRQSTRLEKLKHSKEIERKLQKQKAEEERRQQEDEEKMEEEWRKHKADKERQKRIENRERGSRSNSEDRWTTEDNSSISSYQTSTGGFAASSVGRKTNNSLSAAMGEIVMPHLPPPLSTSHHKKHKSPPELRTREDDLRISMYKIMNRLKSHEDAWPFCEPVDESTAPNYYEKIKQPMDLTRMEEKLDDGQYKRFHQFQADFQQIVDNCCQYNGLDNEYTDMVRRLQQIFRDAVHRYLDERSSGSEDEGYPLHTPKKRGRKKKSIVLSPRSLTPTREEEDKENEEKSSTIPINSDSEREREELESIKSLSNEPKPPKRRRGRPSKERTNNIPKNSSAAIEALELVTEQTLKDINKWLDDTPRFSEYSNSASNSPSQVLGVVEDYESRARIEAEYQRTLSKIDKIDKAARKEALQQKRRHMKEQAAAANALLNPATPAMPPVKKKREIQSTIDRLQPGKSKGNLISNTKETIVESNTNILLPLSKIREKEKPEVEDKTEPQLSLGTVLTSDVIGFGITPRQHSFSDVEADSSQGSKEKEEVAREETEVEPEKIVEEEKIDEKQEVEEKVDVIVEEESMASPAPVGPPAKDTKPNFNAWFKAFGAPKVILPTGKRKADFVPRDSPDDPSEDIPDVPPPTPGRSLGLERQRKLSTGSSVSESERSSLSQEPAETNVPSVDDPYVSPQQGHSPYHHSPSNAAPIKVGFYQDTFPRGGSDKSSSCSPRDPPSNQNSPHLQIVSPVQSPKEPNVYSNPLSPYVYDAPPSTPSYPSHSRDVPYYEPPPVYTVNPASYPVKKRIYTDIEQIQPPQGQHPRLMEHFSDPRFIPLALHSPYSNPPEGPKSPPSPHDTSHFPYPAYTNNTNLPKSPPTPVTSAIPLHPSFNTPEVVKSAASSLPSNDNRFSSLGLHSPYSNTERAKSPAPAHSASNRTPLNYSNYAMPSQYVPPTSQYEHLQKTPQYEHIPKAPIAQYEHLTKAPISQYENLTKPPTSQYEHLTKPPSSQYEHLTKPPTSQYEHLTKPPTSPYDHLPKPPNSQFEHLTKPPSSNYEHLTKPPTSQYEHLMSHFNSTSPAADLSYSMYLKNSASGNYPLNFPQHRPYPKPLPSPSANYTSKALPNPIEEPVPLATAMQKKQAAKRPRKKKGLQEVPVPSISSGSNTAFQQYLGQNSIVPPTPTGYSYSYLEEMRNSGYYGLAAHSNEAGAPNVKSSSGSPFSFGRAPPHAPQPNYSSPTPAQLAQYQQYLMLGYSPGYLPPPPHDRPPWPL